jgi:hypothetical protein
MFADLVGSTALSARMGPKDLREVVSAYQQCVAATVSQFDGFVAKYMGDGVLCYFGWPKAHEDDAERAVRAALAVAKAVVALKTPDSDPLEARVGIAIGLAWSAIQPNRFPVLFGNWAVQRMRGESAIHLAQSLKILELAAQQGDDVARLVALKLAGVSHFCGRGVGIGPP